MSHEAAPAADRIDFQYPASADMPAARRRTWPLDLLVFVLLFAAAFAVRYAHTRGDLWSDEADYATAALRGFDANRTDRSEDARRTNLLIRERHYHAPMTVDLLLAAEQFGSREPILRTPFVIAGSLVVGLVYLCGLMLFEGRRDVSAASAAIVLVTPLQVRAGSHAIPWALISLSLVALLWTLLHYVRSGHAGWIVCACIVIGWLAATSESLFPVLLAGGLSLPVLLWPHRNDPQALRRFGMGMGVGVCLALAVLLVFWPAGLTGGMWTNLSHYMHIRRSEDVAKVGGRLYAPTPRWAYLHWYALDYKPYFVLYTLGVLAVLAQLARRQLSRGAALVSILAVVEVTVAHLTIIPGPQYLAHCLPLLTLLTGLCFLSVVRYHRIVGWLVMLAVCLYLARWRPRADLSDEDQSAQVSRWPQAARLLAAHWQPGDMLAVGPQPAVVARWYLLHAAHVPAEESDILQLPASRLSDAWRKRLSSGRCHRVVVSDTFMDTPILSVSPAVRQIIAPWRIAWRSLEPAGRPPRLTIYERNADAGSGSTPPAPPSHLTTYERRPSAR